MSELSPNPTALPPGLEDLTQNVSKQLPVPSDFSMEESMEVMGTRNCLVTKILQNINFEFRRKRSIQVWNKLMIDQILVHRKIELLEAIVCFKTNNQYEIKNSMGQKIFHAKENNDCCTRKFCSHMRRLELEIKDNFDQEVIHIIRPSRCSSCCFPCCLQKMEVKAPPGNTIGYIKQDWHMFKPKFSLYDMSKTKVLSIEGPFCAISCCGDVNFDVTSKDGHSVGRISKQRSGLIKKSLTDANNFGVYFPMDLDVRMKAVLLAACFLIDFIFFEKTCNSVPLSSCVGM